MFLFYEAVKSLGRAKLATFISIITIIVASFLCTSALWLYLSSEKINKYVAEKIEVRIFLKDGLTKEKIKVFTEELKQVKIIKKVIYVSKSEAAREVSKSLGISIEEIIHENPLPDAVVVNFKNIKSDEEIKKIISKIRNNPNVDDVVYEKLLLAKLNEYLPIVKYIIFGLALLFLLVAFYMILIVNRMVIEKNNRNYEIMKLVGANLSTIRLPIIINGFLLSIISVILSTPILFLFYKFANSILAIGKFEFDLRISIIAFIIFAFVLGIAGSIYSSRKISLKFKY